MLKCYKLKWKSGEEEIVIANSLFQAGAFYMSCVDCSIDQLN